MNTIILDALTMDQALSEQLGKKHDAALHRTEYGAGAANFISQNSAFYSS